MQFIATRLIFTIFCVFIPGPIRQHGHFNHSWSGVSSRLGRYRATSAHGFDWWWLEYPVDADAGIGKEAKYYDYLPIFDEAIPRIKAGLAFLKSHGNKQVAIAAHACSVHMPMQNCRHISRQSLVADADHYFTDRGCALVEAIGEWLNSLDIW